MESRDHALVIPFDDQSESYTCGFEAGMIWADMERHVPSISKTVKATNIAVLRRQAAQAGYGIEFQDVMIDGTLSEWVHMTAQLSDGGGGTRAANDINNRNASQAAA